MTNRQEFPKRVRLAAWERCGGKCECGCGQKIITPHYDHVLPDALGGEATLENCAVLDVRCHRRKTSERDRPAIDKAVRGFEKRIGAREKRSRPMPGTKRSAWKHKISGEWVRR